VRRFRLARKSHFGAAIALLLAGVPAAASACSICIGFPGKTDADYLVEADCVVLARESAQNPFTFAPQETLKGHYDDSEIGLLADSKTRRILRANPDRWVILVQDARRGPWRSLGIVTKPYLSVARRIVVMLSDSGRPATAQQRWEFFLPLFGHGDSRVQQLAYLEMGRAPYQVIKRLGRIASRDDWMPMLTDPRYFEWRPLAILLLAQSEQPQDNQRVLDAFHSAHRFGITTNLAAWAAAAIEVESESTIRFIEDEYFCRAQSSAEELEAITTSLSMHGSQQVPERQDRIVAGYRVLLQHHPQFAPQVADDLHAWKRSELTDVLAAIQASETELVSAGKQSIQRYLRAVASAKESALAHD